MGYNTKIYQETCGNLVTGGTLKLKDGATLNGFPKAENQAESTAATIAELKTDFNSLLEKLKTAGLMKAD